MATVPDTRHHRPHFSSTRPRLTQGDFCDQFLSESHAQLVGAGDEPATVFHVMENLFLTLNELRSGCTQEEWQILVDKCRNHPLCGLIHQDPFTHRAFSKPRGYAGDAVMMDYIYGREEFWNPPPATPLGLKLFDYTTSAPASEGVRARRGFIADLLDDITADQGKLRILSVASGHLREANLSSAVRRRRFDRFVALDADPKSLEEVQRSYSCYGVETILARVTRLIDERMSLGQFDLIYSLGLFDYLPQRLGQRIAKRLFEMLRPNGKIVLANFLPSIRDIGYMEAYMDWNLIYRTRRDMIDLLSDLPQSMIKHVQLVAEENQNIIFVMATRG